MAPPAFKAGGTGDPRPAGSIPVHLRHLRHGLSADEFAAVGPSYLPTSNIAWRRPITLNPLLISLPIADRPRAHAFYTEALGLEAPGEPADDGVPEPLLFVLNQQTRLMLVPTGGFGWVIGDRDVASAGASECVLGIAVDSDTEVEAIVERARRAGAAVSAEPAPQPWGYAATFTDPDGHLWSVTSARLPV